MHVDHDTFTSLRSIKLEIKNDSQQHAKNAPNRIQISKKVPRVISRNPSSRGTAARPPAKGKLRALQTPDERDGGREGGGEASSHSKFLTTRMSPRATMTDRLQLVQQHGVRLQFLRRRRNCKFQRR